MAYASNAPGEALLFQFGDGADPETFSAACAINTDRSLDLSSEIFQGTVPNCTDPSAPAKTVRRVKSLDVKFSGSGIADMPSFKTLLQLWQAGLPFNGRVTQDVDVAGYVIAGKWVIESLQESGSRGDDQTFSISLGVADEFTITYP